MDSNKEYALVKLYFSKGDLYTIEKILSFKTKGSAVKFKNEIKDVNSGCRWPDWYEYEVLIFKDKMYFYLNGDKVKTVFD